MIAIIFGLSSNFINSTGISLPTHEILRYQEIQIMKISFQMSESGNELL
jgi:hypothetical protein